MPNPKKEKIVNQVAELVRQSPVAILAEYRGLKHSEMTELRRACRKEGARFMVVKNRLLRLALKQAGRVPIDQLLVGPTAVMLAQGDAAPSCKLLSDYAKKHDELKLKGALIEDTVYSGEQVRVMATLPPREVIYAQIAGAVVGGVRGIASGLNELMAQLARLMNAVAEKKAA